MPKPKAKKLPASAGAVAAPDRPSSAARGRVSKKSQGVPVETTGPKKTRGVPTGAAGLDVFAIGAPTSDRVLPEGFQSLPPAGLASATQPFEQLQWLSRRSGLSQQTPWGALPLGFVEATGITLPVVARLCSEHDDRDAFIFNLTPSDEAIFANPLARAYVARPELVKSMQTLLESLHCPPSMSQALVGSSAFSISPFMVARQALWVDFLAFLQPAHALASGPFGASAGIHQPFDDSSQSLSEQTPFTVFMGAMLPHFLQSEAGKGYRVLKVSIPSLESSLNSHLQSLRQLRDAAAKTQSGWLIGAWLNYRNLYLLQVAGKAWCERHLRVLSEGVLVGAKNR